MTTSLVWLGSLCIGVYVTVYVTLFLCFFVLHIFLAICEVIGDAIESNQRAAAKARKERAAKRAEIAQNGFTINLWFMTVTFKTG